MIVAVVVLVSVGSGGMRSITFVQAFQYWLKLTALLVPAAILLVVWAGDGTPSVGAGDGAWSLPLGDGGGQGLYTTYSLMMATFLGTMGLPHVVVRFYTNHDGRAARRTTLVVLALLGAFYLLPPIYAALGRAYGADPSRSDALVLELPQLITPGTVGDLLTGLLTAGAFAAFLSTSSGLAVAVAGVLTQDVVGRVGRRRHAGLSEITAFRLAVVAAVAVPLWPRWPRPTSRSPGRWGSRSPSPPRPSARSCCSASGGAASPPPGRSPGCSSAAPARWSRWCGPSPTATPSGWADVLLEQPAAWSVPAAFAAMLLVSRATRRPARRTPGGSWCGCTPRRAWSWSAGEPSHTGRGIAPTPPRDGQPGRASHYRRGFP